MAEEAKESKAGTSIYTLLAQAQGEMGQPIKDQTASIKTKSGYTYTYKYSSLASIEAIVKPPLNARGVFVGQRTVVHESLGVCIQTYIAHGDSEIVLDYEPYQLDRDPKENGSRTTYAKRYGMCKAFCLEGMEDGDIQGIDPKGNPVSLAYEPYNQPQQPLPADNRRESLQLMRTLKQQAIANGVSEQGINEWYAANVGDVTPGHLTDAQLQTVLDYLSQIVSDTNDGHLKEGE